MTRRSFMLLLPTKGSVIALPGFDNLPVSATAALDLKIIMKLFHYIIVIAATISVSACSTVMTTSRSGYLSDYSALTKATDSASAGRAVTQAIDPAQVSIAEVAWRVDARPDIGNDERDALIAQLRRELQHQVRALPVAPQGRPAQIRAAVTRVETVSPGLNTIGTLLLIGPLDRGGAAVEIEAVDPQTGRQLAALKLGYFTPLSDLKARFSKLAPAEIAVRKAAADFAALLKPPAGAAELAQRRTGPEWR
jgi:hypothetical protein